MRSYLTNRLKLWRKREKLPAIQTPPADERSRLMTEILLWANVELFLLAVKQEPKRKEK